MVIGFSHQQIGRAVAEFLLNRGYRHIGIVSTGDNRAKIRARAFIKTLAKRGNIQTATIFVSQPTNFRLGREGLAQFDRAIMGRRAAEALLARINGEPVTESYIDIGFTILERQTT